MRLWNLLRNNLLWLLLLPLLVLSCKPDPPQPEPEPVPDVSASGLYIINEVLFQHNNSSLSYYNFRDGSFTENIFLDVNHRGLGDVGNDLQQYGSKLYIVVNNSNIVEVVDVNTVQSLKTISLSGKQPRYVTFLDNKAYVSCFDGDVVRIDTASLQVESTVHTGLNPDGICVCNGKIYVSNSGGLNAPNYGNTVSVIDPASFTVTKNITVDINPTRIKSWGNRYVYVVSNGDYYSVPANFQKIDAQSDEVVKTYNLEVVNFDIYQNLAYIYTYDYTSMTSAWIKVLDLETDEVIKDQFISDGTQLKTPYGIKVNPLNGDVYITDAGTFTTNGDVYCFDNQGRKKFSFEAGLNPQAMVFSY
jgi:DNA-binding beta-propeller fold protein YncE